jgi:hypothetical protein
MLTHLEEYLKPNPYLRPPRPCPELWAPPEPSRGLRHIAMRSRGSSRGHIVLENGYWLDFESRLERNVALAFLARPDTVDVVEQTPCVEYVDDDGELHEHTFDLCVTRAGGAKTVVFVKPSALLRPAHRRMLHLIAEQMSPQVAQQVLLVTEKKLNRADLYNAEFIQEVKREPNSDDDAVIARLITGMHGRVGIADLVEASGLHGQGFRAIVRAIAAGDICLTAPGMIAPDAVVERRPG